MWHCELFSTLGCHSRKSRFRFPPGPVLCSLTSFWVLRNRPSSIVWCPYETSNFGNRCLSQKCPKQVIVINFMKLLVCMLMLNPTYFQFMTFMIGLDFVSFTWVGERCSPAEQILRNQFEIVIFLRKKYQTRIWTQDPWVNLSKSSRSTNCCAWAC